MEKNKGAVHISDAIIFFICYLISLLFNCVLGFNRVAFGNIVIYSIIFGLFETGKILFFKWRNRIILFFMNVYFAYCLTSLYFCIKSKANFILKKIVLIKLNEYILLLGISIFLSFIGYLFLIIRFYRRKRKCKHLYL